MFHIREEGEEPKIGLNFYPKSSNQLGVLILFTDKIAFSCRYNKLLNKPFVGWIKVN